MNESERADGASGKPYAPRRIGARIAADLRQFWLVALLAAIIWFFFDRIFGGVCPVPLLTGFPCPGCGMTRAVWYMLTGSWQASWASNPTAVLWVAGALYFFAMRYLFGRKAKGIGVYIVLVAVLTAAVYGYRMLCIFPGEEPLVYHAGNLLEKLVPGYGTRFGR